MHPVNKIGRFFSCDNFGTMLMNELGGNGTFGGLLVWPSSKNVEYLTQIRDTSKSTEDIIYVRI